MSEARRTHLVEVAAELLATGGPEAVTTRSVALAAGVQAPTIYRLFGDKDGLLDAVVEHGFTTYVGSKRIDPDADPVDELRAGWDLHIGFGLANPALFRLMHAAVRSFDALETGREILRRRIHRVARAGRLRVSERRAEELIHAAGTGVVFALLERPAAERDGGSAAERDGGSAAKGDGGSAAKGDGGSAAKGDGGPAAKGDEGLADAAWQSVCAAILTDRRPQDETGPAAAAVTLRAALPDLPGFTPAERQLLGEWLARIG